MQQYVIFNVLKEYCIPKEEERFFVKTAGHQIEYVKQATFMQTGASRMGLSDGQPLEVGYSENIYILC